MCVCGGSGVQEAQLIVVTSFLSSLHLMASYDTVRLEVSLTSPPSRGRANTLNASACSWTLKHTHTHKNQCPQSELSHCYGPVAVISTPSAATQLIMPFAKTGEHRPGWWCSGATASVLSLFTALQSSGLKQLAMTCSEKTHEAVHVSVIHLWC